MGNPSAASRVLSPGGRGVFGVLLMKRKKRSSSLLYGGVKLPRREAPDEAFVVTEEWLRRWATDGHVGWPAKQLAAIGVSWPPRKGWLQSLIGVAIPDEMRQNFERLSKRQTHSTAPSPRGTNLDTPGFCVACNEDAPKRFD